MFDYEGSRGEFLKVLAELGEEPAFVRRARSVTDATDELFRHCDAHREELLRWPRIHLAALADRTQQDWSRLSRFLADDEMAGIFSALYQQWEPPTRPSASWASTDRQLLVAFLESAERFNRNWERFLEQLNLDQLNQLRRNYNEYYPIEKACAFGSEHAAREFVPLEMVTIEQLRSLFPPLLLPELK